MLQHEMTAYEMDIAEGIRKPPLQEEQKYPQ